MSFVAQAEVPPLSEDPTGGIRVGQSRVLLELVICAFQDGATPETIVQRYPTLQLEDVYAVVAYYLLYRGEVEQYLAQREQQAKDVQLQLEGRQPDLADIRTRLRAKRGA